MLSQRLSRNLTLKNWPMNNKLDLESLFSVQGKIALVTGGSRGIGYMCAEALVQNGARVYIVSRNAKELNEAARNLNLIQPASTIAIPADL